MHFHTQRDHSRVHPLLKILLVIVLLVGISFSLAWVWQTTQQQNASAQNAPDPQTLSLMPQSSTTDATEAPVFSEAASQTQADSSSEQPSGASGAMPIPVDGAVAQSAPVGNEYFNDAIFLGDSITTGVSLYHIADNAAVVAMTGINTENINHKKVIDSGDGSGNRLTILEAAKAHGPRNKVYIMLGGNGIGYDKQTFISGYRTFLDSVKEQYPGAIIYLQSMTPVVADYVNEFDPTMNNAKIDEYNLEILKLAKQESVYYLDVASAFKDANGALPREASPVDGLHFVPEYYAKWFEYLKSHTVEVSP